MRTELPAPCWGKERLLSRKAQFALERSARPSGSAAASSHDPLTAAAEAIAAHSKMAPKRYTPHSNSIEPPIASIGCVRREARAAHWTMKMHSRMICEPTQSSTERDINSLRAYSGSITFVPARKLLPFLVYRLKCLSNLLRAAPHFSLAYSPIKLFLGHHH